MANGMPLDNATLQRIISAKGGANTPDNMNRIREFAGANPDVLERYSMQGGRSNQDNSDLLNLDKQMAVIDGAQPQITQSELPPLPTVQASTGQTRKSATAGPPFDQPGVPAGPGGSERTNPTARGEPTGGSAWDWLLPLIVGGAAASQFRNPNDAPLPADRTQQRIEDVNKNNPRLAGPRTPQQEEGQRRLTYQPKLTDEGGPRMPGGAPEIPKGAPQRAGAAMQDPAEVARIQAEIDAENRAAQLLQDQMLERQGAQRRTQQLGEAAKRATGRR